MSNSGSIFCCLMEMCLGDQKFVTLLLYLVNICVFAISRQNVGPYWICVQMAERIQFKNKTKKCHFSQHQVVFLGYVLPADGISANPKMVDNVKDWLVPTNPKELQ